MKRILIANNLLKGGGVENVLENLVCYLLKHDNEIALIDILENDEKSLEDEIDLKIKTKKLYDRMKDILKGREKTIIELRFGLRRNKT